ncbi:hypothetical protein EDD17DRAFT_1535205, partial [Pisolithus thermaeus]
TALTLSRILAYESLPKGIQVEVPDGLSSEGKKTKEKVCFVDVGVFPMGIDVNSLREKVEYRAQLRRQRYASVMLIVGRDTVDVI